jgi:ubiquinone/menaquinone biosynthesis C-methylase UbiE
VKALHYRLVFRRRVDVLARALTNRFPTGARILDIGCGSGDIAHEILRLRPDLSIEGLDVLVRPHTAIPVTQFDGYSIPMTDHAFDFTMLVDVLHHTDEPGRLLKEAARASKEGVVLKDHFNDGIAAEQTLRFMDWVGNAKHGVRLPYNYLSEKQWRETWSDLGLEPFDLTKDLGLYPRPFDSVFGRGLHFITTLKRSAA